MKTIKEKLQDYIVQSNLLECVGVIMYFFRVFPIKSNKVVLIHLGGKGYGDSAKYIGEALLRDSIDYDLVWVFDKHHLNTELPSGIRPVRVNSIKYFFELATAKVWINTGRFDVFIKKRKNQYYISTWHASVTVKKVEYEAYNIFSKHYKSKIDYDYKLIDLALSNCDITTERVFRSGYHYTGPIAKTGTPRDDILVNFKHNKHIVRKVKRYYGVEESTELILYAPTYRDSYEDSNPFNVDFRRLINVCEEKFGRKYKLIIRLHHKNNKEAMKLINIGEGMIDGTDYLDMQELICASDILISDYSSTMMDGLIGKKKVFLYVPDLETYEKSRGNVFDFNTLPFPISRTNDQLMDTVRNFDDITFVKKYDDFAKRFIGFYQMGNASNSAARIIKEICTKKVIDNYGSK